MSASEASARRVRRRRDKLRASGLRPVQIWVPDTRADGFAEECIRQARLVRAREAELDRSDDEKWFDTSDTSGWTG